MICARALRRTPRWRYRDALKMSRALRRWDGRDPALARDELAQWMAQLFHEELAVREQALAQARKDPTRHRQVQEAGFELVEEAKLEAVRPRRNSSVTHDSIAKIARRPVAPVEGPRVNGFAVALTSGRWFWAVLSGLVLLGVSFGIYWGMSFERGGGEEYGYLSVTADSNEVEVMIGNRKLGRAPVQDVVVIPGRHRIVGILGDERETVEIVVPAGHRETVRLSLQQQAPPPR